MCFRKWFRKRDKDVLKPVEAPAKPIVLPTEPVRVAPTPPSKPEGPVLMTPVEQEKKESKPEPKPESKPEIKPKSQIAAVPAKPALPKTPSQPTTGRYSGKYEIFPEAGFYKYRLKASNGEILVVSQGYAAKSGVAAGIETFKKNVEGGLFEIYTDKSGFAQFTLFSANKSRLMAAGEFYESEARAQSAIESVKKFVGTDKIIYLEQLPSAEIREEIIDLKPIDLNPSGKVEVGADGKEWIFTLKASNGEVLFTSNGYSSKSGALTGLEAVRKAVELGSFRVAQDKQKRFQFRIYATNSQLIMTGETYPNKESCFSAVDSVRRFLPGAKIIETESVRRKP